MDIKVEVSENKASEFAEYHVAIQTSRLSWIFNKLMFLNAIVVAFSVAFTYRSTLAVAVAVFYGLFITLALEVGFVLVRNSMRDNQKEAFLGQQIEITDHGVTKRVYEGLVRGEVAWSCYSEAIVLPDRYVLVAKRRGLPLSLLPRFPEQAQNDRFLTFLNSILTISYSDAQLHPYGAPVDYAKSRKWRIAFALILILALVAKLQNEPSAQAGF